MAADRATTRDRTAISTNADARRIRASSRVRRSGPAPASSTAAAACSPGKLDEIEQGDHRGLRQTTPPCRRRCSTRSATAWDDVGNPLLKAAIEGGDQRPRTRPRLEVPSAASTDTAFVALINNGGSGRRALQLPQHRRPGRQHPGRRRLRRARRRARRDDDQPRPRRRPGAGRPGVPLRAGARTPTAELITGITAEDVFTTLEITRGWLSNGVSAADDDQRRRRRRPVHRLPQRRGAEPQRRRRRRRVHRAGLRAEGLERQRARPHRHEGRRRRRHDPVRRQRAGGHRRRRRLRHRAHRRHRVRRRLRRHRHRHLRRRPERHATSTSRSWWPTAPRATTASSSSPPASTW